MAIIFGFEIDTFIELPQASHFNIADANLKLNSYPSLF